MTEPKFKPGDKVIILTGGLKGEVKIIKAQVKLWTGRIYFTTEGYSFNENQLKSANGQILKDRLNIKDD